MIWYDDVVQQDMMIQYDTVDDNLVDLIPNHCHRLSVEPVVKISQNRSIQNLGIAKKDPTTCEQDSYPGGRGSSSSSRRRRSGLWSAESTPEWIVIVKYDHSTVKVPLGKTIKSYYFTVKHRIIY